MYTIKSKPPYLIGLVCILPLIGGLVGLVLLLYGIFKYKDKWLVLIGFGGVLLTIIVYFFIFYNMKYGKNTAKGYAKISQIELNHLVKNIEFYKLQNNKYPDSLEQLMSEDPMIVINDPLLLKKMDKTIETKFQYKKIGNQYKLFSVGIDGIPFTNDDIYPSLENHGIYKPGFINK